MKIFIAALLAISAILQLSGRELHIIATCDMHGNLSGFARLLPVIQQYPDAVKLDLGDLFQGEVLPDLLKGEPMMSALNLAKYDFFIPGNHEFELPLPQLAGLFGSFNGQILGQFRIPGVKILPWQLVKRNGFTLAVIGMTDNPNSPLGQNCDHILLVKTDIVSVVDSLVAPMSVTNALIAAVVSSREEELTKTFNALERIWEEYNVYQKHDDN